MSVKNVYDRGIHALEKWYEKHGETRETSAGARKCAVCGGYYKCKRMATLTCSLYCSLELKKIRKNEQRLKARGALCSA